MATHFYTASSAYGALIAAVAVSRGLPVFTRNADDFRHIDGLDVHEV